MNAAYFRDPLPTALLLACGFNSTVVEPEWEDIGGPENGPKLVGHNGYTAWIAEDSKDVHEVIMVENKVVDINYFPADHYHHYWDDIPF